MDASKRFRTAPLRKRCLHNAGRNQPYQQRKFCASHCNLNLQVCLERRLTAFINTVWNQDNTADLVGRHKEDQGGGAKSKEEQHCDCTASNQVRYSRSNCPAYACSCDLFSANSRFAPSPLFKALSGTHASINNVLRVRVTGWFPVIVMRRLWDTTTRLISSGWLLDERH
jgi:hypothetical protein